MQPKTDAMTAKGKSPSALKTIGETAEILGVPQHVLRFWETKFPQIKPLKRNGGRRFYRPEDIETLLLIQHLLYKQGYTIDGARKAFDRDIIQQLRAGLSKVGQGEPVAQHNDNSSDAEAPLDPRSLARELRRLSAALATRRPSDR